MTPNYRSRPPSAAAENAQYARGKTMLDGACGVGYGSCLLARAGANQVTGVDISDEAICFARRQYSENNLAHHVGSAYDLTALPVLT